MKKTFLMLFHRDDDNLAVNGRVKMLSSRMGRNGWYGYQVTRSRSENFHPTHADELFIHADISVRHRSAFGATMAVQFGAGAASLASATEWRHASRCRRTVGRGNRRREPSVAIAMQLGPVMWGSAVAQFMACGRDTLPDTDMTRKILLNHFSSPLFCGQCR
jgi:hypothetical protein